MGNFSPGNVSVQVAICDDLLLAQCVDKGGFTGTARATEHHGKFDTLLLGFTLSQL